MICSDVYNNFLIDTVIHSVFLRTLRKARKHHKKTPQENGNATLPLPSYVMDSMVLQQNKTTTLSGSAQKSSSGKTISVTLREGKHKYASSSTIDKAGKNSIKLPRIKGSLAQYTMEFAIATTVMKTVHDACVGELFIAAGQSNMEINYNDYFKSDSAFKTNTSSRYTRDN